MNPKTNAVHHHPLISFIPHSFTSPTIVIASSLYKPRVFGIPLNRIRYAICISYASLPGVAMQDLMQLKIHPL